MVARHLLLLIFCNALGLCQGCLIPSPIEEQPADVYNPCNATDAGTNFNCQAATEDRCHPELVDTSDLPVSTEAQYYPPNLHESYQEWVPPEEEEVEYWPGTCCDHPADDPTPVEFGPFPSFVKHMILPNGSTQWEEHYFVNIRHTKNIAAREPGAGANWTSYWRFACSLCAEAFCRPDAIICEDIATDGGIWISDNHEPICSMVCGTGSLQDTDAGLLRVCTPIH